VLAAIASAVRPLAPRDLRVLGRIGGRLRARPRFPGPVEATGSAAALAEAGLTLVEDERERYEFAVRSREDAELVLSSLYLPGTRRSRVEAAVEYLEDRLRRRDVVQVAIPVRRVVAIR